jgi:hypothetical protein
MTLYRNQGPLTTVAPNQALSWTTTFPGANFVGPIAVCADIPAIRGPNGNNINPGAASSGDVTVSAAIGSSGMENSVVFGYSYTITNVNPFPLMYQIAIGRF